MSGWCLDCGSERCVYDDASILPTAAGDTLEDEAA
jgi:ribosomal protein S27E